MPAVSATVVNLVALAESPVITISCLGMRSSLGSWNPCWRVYSTNDCPCGLHQMMLLHDETLSSALNVLDLTQRHLDIDVSPARDMGVFAKACSDSKFLLLRSRRH